MATTEPGVARAVLLSAFLAVLASAVAAQETPPSAEQLLERLGQIQDEVAARPPAADLLTPEQIDQQIGKRLGVQVLAVESVEAADTPRYAVKVMNPPGNYNGALQVSTLMVDAVTGEILGEQRPLRPIQVPDSDDSGTVARFRTYR